MTPQESAELLAFATDVAAQAGQATLAHFQATLAIDIKADDSPVTIADREAERIMRRLIEARYPGDAILGEEMGETSAGSRRRWIIDPIDGTRSFIRGVPLFGVMIALEEDGVIIAGVLHFPALGETVSAARGSGCWWNGQRTCVSTCSSMGDALVLTTDAHNFAQRASRLDALRRDTAPPMIRTWGDCYGYALVATGRAEGMFDPTLSPWDVAAVIPIIEEAGGVITDISGGAAWPFASSAIATNAVLAGEIRALVGSAA